MHVVAPEDERCFDGALMRKFENSDVITNLWDWHERRCSRASAPLAAYALDRCEELFAARAWKGFGYWDTIYVRERQEARCRTTPYVARKG